MNLFKFYPWTFSAKRFFVASLGLLVCGLLILYSASTVESFTLTGGPNALIVHQLVFGAGIGLLLLLILSRVNYHIFSFLALPLLCAAFSALLLVYVPGLGFSSGGATRWLDLKIFTFQPGELAKFAAVIYASFWLAKLTSLKRQQFADLLPVIFVGGSLFGLLLIQPDFGTSVVLVGCVGFLIFLHGTSKRQMLALVLLCITVLSLAIAIEPYRAARLQTFFNPSRDPLGADYQINQSLIAIGSGGIFGYGYGLSRQKHNYLPEAIGDSVFAVASEELGFLRMTFLVILFVVWLVLGLQIAGRAPDNFGRLLASGFVVLLGLQALVNASAIIGLLPLTGIPMPFLSYGSSALIINLSACGIIINIARQSRV